MILYLSFRYDRYVAPILTRVSGKPVEKIPGFRYVYKPGDDINTLSKFKVR